MTQHLMQEDTYEDQRTMRRLATVIAMFMGFTVLLAIGVNVVMG